MGKSHNTYLGKAFWESFQSFLGAVLSVFKATAPHHNCHLIYLAINVPVETFTTCFSCVKHTQNGQFGIRIWGTRDSNGVLWTPVNIINSGFHFEGRRTLLLERASWYCVHFAGRLIPQRVSLSVVLVTVSD